MGRHSSRASPGLQGGPPLPVARNTWAPLLLLPHDRVLLRTKHGTLVGLAISARRGGGTRPLLLRHAAIPADTRSAGVARGTRGRR